MKTEAQKKASEKWENKFRQRIVRIPLEKDIEISDYLLKKGISFNSFVLDLINKEIKK